MACGCQNHRRIWLILLCFCKKDVRVQSCFQPVNRTLPPVLFQNPLHHHKKSQSGGTQQPQHQGIDQVYA